MSVSIDKMLNEINLTFRKTRYYNNVYLYTIDLKHLIFGIVKYIDSNYICRWFHKDLYILNIPDLEMESLKILGSRIIGIIKMWNVPLPKNKEEKTIFLNLYDRV